MQVLRMIFRLGSCRRDGLCTLWPTHDQLGKLPVLRLARLADIRLRVPFLGRDWLA